MTKLNLNLYKQPAALTPQADGDRLTEYMQQHNLPMTRQTWLNLNGTPNGLSPEEESLMPEQFRKPAASGD